MLRLGCTFAHCCNGEGLSHILEPYDADGWVEALREFSQSTARREKYGREMLLARLNGGVR